MLAISLASAAPGQVIYVDDDAPSGGSGATWATACKHLQDALVLAADGPSGVEVRIAGGTYYADRGDGRAAGDRTESFLVASQVTVRGGYAGLAGPVGDVRDPMQWPSILSGDLASNDDPSGKNFDENSYRVVSVPDATGVTIEGLTIESGFANGAEGVHDLAPAMWLDGSFAEIRDVHFRNHMADDLGAVVDLAGSTFTECTFTDLTSWANAGALYCGPGAFSSVLDCAFVRCITPGNGGGVLITESVDVIGCTFDECDANRGGGVFTAVDSQSCISLCTFTGNHASRAGGGVFNNQNTTEVLACTFIANDTTDSEGGAGIWNEEGQPAVYNCIFDRNVSFAGAGVYSIRSTALVVNCVFTNNDADTGGGAWADDGAPIIMGCSFIDNTAKTGGGVYNETTRAVVIDCHFEGNRTDDGDGGGGATNAFDSAPIYYNCTFTDNYASNTLFGGGGGVANYISGAWLVNCRFTRNSAALGGGAVYNELGFEGEDPTFSHCIFEGNFAPEGGAIYNFRDDPLITNCAFVGNSTVPGGQTGMQRGSAIFNHFISDPLVINTTFAANSGEKDSAIYNADNSFPVFRNCILWSADRAAAPMIVGDPATVEYAIVRGGYAGHAVNDADPLFAGAPAAGIDGEWGTADDEYGDLRVRQGSPAIDAGKNALVPLDRPDIDEDGDLDEFTPVDVAGSPRFVADPAADTGCGSGAIVDLGAYERQGGIVIPVRIGDVTNDGSVTTDDLVVVIGSWGPCGDPCCIADITGDGVVDFADLLRLIANWG